MIARRTILLLLGGALSALACRGGERTRAGGGAADSLVSVSVAAPARKPLLVEHDTVALHAPPWTVASAVAAMQAAGLHPVPAGGSVRYHGVAVPGTRIRIDDGEVQLFVYGDANMAGTAADSIAQFPVEVLQRAASMPTNAASPPAAQGAVSRAADTAVRPLVIGTDNLVAIVFARSTEMRQRVHAALLRDHTM